MNFTRQIPIHLCHYFHLTNLATLLNILFVYSKLLAAIIKHTAAADFKGCNIIMLYALAIA